MSFILPWNNWDLTRHFPVTFSSHPNYVCMALPLFSCNLPATVCCFNAQGNWPKLGWLTDYIQAEYCATTIVKFCIKQCVVCTVVILSLSYVWWKNVCNYASPCNALAYWQFIVKMMITLTLALTLCILTASLIMNWIGRIQKGATRNPH